MNVTIELEQIKEFFHPRIIGSLNDHYIKLAKIKGDDVPWHHHNNSDELFYIIKGTLLLEIANLPLITLNAGDFYVVKRNEQHRVYSKEECHVMLIENKETSHTGDVISPITKSIDSQFY